MLWKARVCVYKCRVYVCVCVRLCAYELRCINVSGPVCDTIEDALATATHPIAGKATNRADTSHLLFTKGAKANFTRGIITVTDMNRMRLHWHQPKVVVRGL